MPQAGEIIHYSDYVFEDGSKGDELFVILNAADIDSPSLVLKTTSQSRRYEGVLQGCNPQKKVFFVPADWGRCFELDIYIQLPQVLEISTEELLKGALSKKIRIIGALPGDCLAQLKDCLRRFKEDISPQHWKLIFQS